MRLFCLWIIAGFVVWPISSTVAMAGTKPIDIILSDLLFAVLPILVFAIRSYPPKVQSASKSVRSRWFCLPPYLALLCIVYMTALAGIGLGMTGESVRIY